MLLPGNLQIKARELLESLHPTETLIYLTNSDRLGVSYENMVSNETSASTFNDIQIIGAFENSLSNAQYKKLSKSWKNIVGISDFMATMNSPGSFEADSNRNEAAETLHSQYFMRIVIFLL